MDDNIVTLKMNKTEAWAALRAMQAAMQHAPEVEPATEWVIQRLSRILRDDTPDLQL